MHFNLEGGVYLAGEVIDLLQDMGLPPPQSRERLIFPPANGK